MLREGMERKAFAESIGVVDGTLGNYERGDRSPDWNFLETLRQKKGINLNWLFTGEGEMYSSDERSVAALSTDNIVRLPRFDARASAGRGLIAVDQMPIGEVAFARDFLRNLGANPEYCYILEARGDSMWPTIPDGALLIADASKTEVDDGRIYHFNVMDRVLVKRARWSMDGKLHLTSDNVAAGYPSEEFTADRIDELRVGGRIMFTGHAPMPVR
ncbi:XRE family transcriptional regulator [Rhizobium leguminosarum]|uniref:XRE family transcriptional regulator n=1 Tax=Rhizobium leguminosarum TaxID=384 RepID=UPI001FEDA96F|nr:S24 family peptidase [Rhizobium leguminosarum]